MYIDPLFTSGIFPIYMSFCTVTFYISFIWTLFIELCTLNLTLKHFLTLFELASYYIKSLMF